MVQAGSNYEKSGGQNPRWTVPLSKRTTLPIPMKPRTIFVIFLLRIQPILIDSLKQFQKSICIREDIQVIRL